MYATTPLKFTVTGKLPVPLLALQASHGASAVPVPNRTFIGLQTVRYESPDTL